MNCTESNNLVPYYLIQFSQPPSRANHPMLRLTRLRPLLRPAQTRASHIGAAPIPIPPELSLSLSDALPEVTSNALTITGPRGTTSIPLPPFVSLSLSPYTPTASSSPYRTSSSGLSTPNDPPKTSSPPTHALEVSVQNPEKKQQRAAWGLTRALLANAVTGISRGFSVELNLVGVGYRAVLEADPARVGEKGERLGLKVCLGLGFGWARRWADCFVRVICSLGSRIGFIFLFRPELLPRFRCLHVLCWVGTISTS